MNENKIEAESESKYHTMGSEKELSQMHQKENWEGPADVSDTVHPEKQQHKYRVQKQIEHDQVSSNSKITGEPYISIAFPLWQNK